MNTQDFLKNLLEVSYVDIFHRAKKEKKFLIRVDVDNQTDLKVFFIKLLGMNIHNICESHGTFNAEIIFYVLHIHLSEKYDMLITIAIAEYLLCAE